MEKHRRSGRAINDNMAHAHCMLDTKATITHTRWFPTLTVDPRTRLNFTFYIHLPVLSNIPTDKIGILELMHYGIMNIPLPQLKYKFKVGEETLKLLWKFLGF